MKIMPRLLLGAALAAVASAFAAPANYQVVAHYRIGGDAAGYDYLSVDPGARRLYVSHTTRFEVLDADSGKKVGEIGPVVRAHGAAIAAEAGHGFASSGTDALITMFDLKTLATIKQIKSTGANPDAIEYDPATKRVYAANHGSGDVTVIEATSGDIVGTVKFGEGKLEALGFDGRGSGFVLAEDKSAVFVFDLQTLQPKAKWSLAPGEGGTGLAVDPAHHRVFAACANKRVVVLDSDTGKVIATPASGEDPDGLAFDPATGRIFTTNPDGTLSIIQQESADKYSPLPTVSTAPGARTVAFDPKTGRVFTSTAQRGPKPATGNGRAPILPDTFEVIVVGTK
ncbi:MAG: YncE family protein [bacterium]|nr:YncE family protein [bacterium]MDI1336108.1 YncE family protein [Lacunisphaera sp.]